jgi:prepilin-type N-terminal cleavage/methylation domain-containing protein
MNTTPHFRGYTLVELIVSVGLFALVMTLASGAYFMMISVNREAQAATAGIDTVAFAVEKMARSIRTGSSYACNGAPADCTGGGTSFSFTNATGQTVSFARNAGTGSIEETIDGVTRAITDPDVTITTLTFYLSGRSPADALQPRATIVVGGTVSSGPGETKTFLVETGASMRGVDI